MNAMHRSLCLIIFFVLGLTSVTAVPVALSTSPNPEELGGHYQGDMLLEPRVTGRGVAGRFPFFTRWSGGVVPYTIAANISANHSALIVRTMRELENMTAVNNTQCIRFRERNSSDTIFITIHNGSGCSAPVGSWGSFNGVRPVSLMHAQFSTCMTTGIIAHELLHVLGFLHEQSRPDRDNYVSIIWSNIIPQTISNFEKYNDTRADTLMTPYDYASVMHYSANAFAINMSAPTIVPTFNSSAHLGQRNSLSPIDILEIQRYYGCVPTPSSSNTTASTTRTTTTSTSTSTSSRTTSTTTSATMTTATTTTSTSATTATTTSVTTRTTTAGCTSIWITSRSPWLLFVVGWLMLLHLLE